jgi:hypothetical protein
MSKLMMIVAALAWPLTGTLLAMGPDPGGHSGDTVTPTTTRTGQPVENGSAPKSETAPSGAKDEAAKQPAQGTSAPSGATSGGQADKRR